MPPRPRRAKEQKSSLRRRTPPLRGSRRRTIRPTKRTRTPSPAFQASQTRVPSRVAPLWAPPPGVNPPTRGIPKPGPRTTAGAPHPSGGLCGTLPSSYGGDLIVLQIRDPWWLHSYWELLPGTIARGREKLGKEGSAAELALRVYEEGTLRWFDVRLSDGTTDWFIEVDPPDRSWTVEIGLKTRSGRFLALARSNTVRTPPAGSVEGGDGRWGYVKRFPQPLPSEVRR